jgi:hypothetical protein
MESNPSDEFGLTIPVYSRDARLQEPVESPSERGLEVLVIFTDVKGTAAALQMAESLAQKLAAHIRLLLPYEVPYALPLTQPAVPVTFLENQLRRLASEIELNVAGQIYLCRDKKRALSLLLRPGSLVVMGGKKRWWPTGTQRLAKALLKDGHQVIFAESR